MKIALLHLEVSGGPVTDNVEKIIKGIKIAKKSGAEWVITPETAVQGYFFYKKDKTSIKNLKLKETLKPILEAVKESNLKLFLGCVAENKEKNEFYNVCHVIDENAKIIFTQSKQTGHSTGSEAWSTKGLPFLTKEIDGLKLGILICSDTWYEDKAKKAKEENIEVIITPAAWPDFDCGGGLPEEAWHRCSKITKAPIIVCNQTGNKESMDMDSSRSAVIVNEETILCNVSKEEKVLLFEMDVNSKKILSTNFEEHIL